jgi:hypothetical protein
MEEQVVGEELGELGAYSRVVEPYHVTLRVFCTLQYCTCSRHRLHHSRATVEY